MSLEIVGANNDHLQLAVTAVRFFFRKRTAERSSSPMHRVKIFFIRVRDRVHQSPMHRFPLRPPAPTAQNAEFFQPRPQR